MAASAKLACMRAVVQLLQYVAYMLLRYEIQTISIIKYCSMDEFPRFSLSKKSSWRLIFLLFGVTGCVTWIMATLVFALPTDLG